MNEWLIPVFALPVLVLSYWTSSALNEFLRAYRPAGGLTAKESTFPIEPEAFRAQMSHPVDAMLQTPKLAWGTLAAALRRHSDERVERLRQRYVFRLLLLLAVIPLWLTFTVLQYLD